MPAWPRSLAAAPPTSHAWSRCGSPSTTSILAAPYRGAGIGTTLLDALEAHFHGAGIEDTIIGVLPGNPAARLYERLGYRPTWLYLSKLRGR